MATLADSFLADFDSSGDEEEEEESEKEEEDEQKPGGKDDEEPVFDDKDEDEDADEMNDLDGDMQDLDEDGGDIDDIDDIDADGTNADDDGIAAISNLLNDKEMKAHLEKITKVVEETVKCMEEGLPIPEADPDEEYDTIVVSNKYAGVIDNEIATIHRFVRDIYATKFPELEQQVQNPMDYARTVKIIGNITDISNVEDELLGIVPQHTILTISVTATTTTGKPLPEGELKRCMDGCDVILALDEANRKLYEYIESRMATIAPNLSAIIGPDIAARLMQLAGGLEPLSKIPSCNLQVLGQRKNGLGGFSSKTQDFHQGILCMSEIMRTTPRHLRMRTLKVVAGKSALAARVDFSRGDATGETGNEYLQGIIKKIEKWQEPPPPKKQKSIQLITSSEGKRKRGGKRARKQKERMDVTEMMQQKGRQAFGKQELTDDYTGEGYGMISGGGKGGRLSVKKKDTQKLKNRLSRKMQARLKRVKTGPAISGLSSSIAFTPIQGMELVAAPMPTKSKAKSSGYFGDTGFVNVGK